MPETDPLIRHLARLFDYDSWANRELVTQFRKEHESGNSAKNARSLRLLTHIAAAERLWLCRLCQKPQIMVVWPELSLDECASEIAKLEHEWRAYLDGLAPVNLTRTIEYLNTKGEIWKSTVEDMLTHTIIHSAYHRGQIALETRAAGSEPTYTDYIHCVRSGLIE